MSQAASAKVVDDYARRHREQVRTAITAVGPEAVAWLALPPAWTDTLAETVVPSGFEVGSVVEQCEARNWCARRPAARAERTPSDRVRPLLRAATAIADDPQETPETVGVVLRRVREAVDNRASPELLRSPLGRPLRESAARRGLGDVIAAADEPTPARTADLDVASREVLTVLDGTDGAGDPEQTAVPLESLVGVLSMDVLGDLVIRCSQLVDPRTASRLLAAAAARLPEGAVLAAVELIRSRLDDESPRDDAARSYLAVAESRAGDLGAALATVERLGSERMRARTLTSIAQDMAAAPDSRPRLSEVVTRLLNTLTDGTRFDLRAAADAASGIVDAGGVSAGAPVLEKAAESLDSSTRRGTDVAALVRLATSARAVAAPSAARFARAAEDAARAEGDPALRSAALVRTLEVVDGPEREAVLSGALDAAHQVVGDDERADALAAVIAHLDPAVRADPLDELIVLTTSQPAREAFWVPDAAWPDLLRHCADELGPERLRTRARDVARGILAAHREGAATPPVTRLWALLASEIDPADPSGQAVGDRLLSSVERLLKSSTTGEALGWVDVGHRLLPMVQGSFETSLLLAQRRVELAQRADYDRRQLRRFLPREEQIAAFDRLLEAPDDGAWALHFLGHGGVGKTTLLRHLGADLAPTRAAVVARVDFDRLRPEFPLDRPGQLLVELLEELEAHVPAQYNTDYLVAREQLQHVPWWSDDGDRATRLDEAVGPFCEVLRVLDRTVVLVLDTCEELSKFQPAGVTVPQLDAAFDIVEEVHRRVPSVRVVFAGRRPLAGRGAGGWSVDPTAGADGVPAVKDYLAVHEVRGFTRAEAQRYLTVVEDLALTPEQLATALERSRDPYTRDDGTEDGASPRYNPFDLGIYAAAVREGRERVDADVYVEARVRRRLGPRHETLLPVVVVLRRFDRRMLEACVGDAQIEAAWRELRGTEWVGTDVDTATRTPYLEVDHGLLTRLDQYFARADHAPELARVRRELAPRLAQLVRETDLAALSTEAVEAGLRAGTRDGAVTTVDDLSRRVAVAGAWMWAHTVFGRVLGDEGALADEGHPAAASARSLQLTAVSHVHAGDVSRDDWRSIRERGATHPDPEVAAWLQARAGLLADPVDPDALAAALEVASRVRRTSTWRYLWLVGTCLAAVEAHPPPAAAAVLAPLVDDLLDSGFVAAAAMAASLGHPTDPHPGPGREPPEPGSSPPPHGFEEILPLVAGSPVVAPDDAPLLAVDWAAPVRVRDRVRLRALLAGAPLAPAGTGRDADGVRESWFADAIDAVGEIGAVAAVGAVGAVGSDVDADRLAAFLLADRLRAGVVDRAVLGTVAKAVGDRRPPAGTVGLHDRVDPLRVVLSQAFLARGDGANARAALGKSGQFTLAPSAQRRLDVARIDIARRLRLDTSARALRAALGEFAPHEVARVTEANGLLDGGVQAPSPADGLPDAHVRWRVASHAAAVVLDPPLHTWVAFGRAADATGRDVSALDLHLAFDVRESRLLAGSAVGRGAARGVPLAERVAGWVRGHPAADPEERARLLLRSAALEPDGADAARIVGALAACGLGVGGVIGVRQLAVLALEEGELLALRLPARAERLLTAAQSWFRSADDPVGALLARATGDLALWRDGADVRRAALGEAYRAAAGAVSQLPDTLGEAVRVDDARSRSDWRGWRLRLAVLADGDAVAVSADRRRVSTSPELQPDPSRGLVGSWRGRAESAWPSSAKSKAGPASVPVAEPGPLPPRPAVRDQPTAAPSAAPAGPRRAVGRAGSAAALGVGVAGAIVALAATLAGSNRSAQLVGLAVVAGAAVVITVLSWRQSHPRPRPRRLLQFEIRTDAEQDRGPVRLRLTGIVPRRWWPDRFVLGESVVTMASDGPVALTSPGGGPTVADAARVLLGPDAAVSATATVRVPLRLAGFTWERFLAVELGLTDGRLPTARSRLRESFDGHLRQSFDGHVRFAVPARWAGGLTETVAAAAAVREVTPVDVTAPTLAPGQLAVVCAVPVTTSAGDRLAVPGAGSADEPTVLEPDALTPDGCVVVVSGVPTTSAPDPDDPITRKLRRCTAQLVVAGAEGGLFLPSMSPELLAACLRVVTDRLRVTAFMLAVNGMGAAVQAELRARGVPALADQVTEFRPWL